VRRFRPEKFFSQTRSKRCKKSTAVACCRESLGPSIRINITMASKATLRQAFEQFDTDRSGKLSTDEV
jgi:hypothetical protein